eukprot:6476751-Amphidinium_carterae.2
MTQTCRHDSNLSARGRIGLKKRGNSEAATSNSSLPLGVDTDRQLHRAADALPASQPLHKAAHHHACIGQYFRIGSRVVSLHHTSPSTRDQGAGC